MDTRGPALLERPAPRRRPAPRPVPERQPALAHLDVEQLRGLRTLLEQEERRARYWLRSVQGRIDLLSSGGPDSTADSDRLAGVLQDRTVDAGRTVLAALVPTAPLPALPRLSALWAQSTRSPAERTVAVEQLRSAHAQLSDYCAAVQARTVQASTDLIARYRSEPGLCLAALPLQPRPRSRRNA